MSAALSQPASAASWVPAFVMLGAIWGASFLFVHLAVGDFGPLATSGLRVMIAAAFLLPFVVWRGQLHLLRQHAWPLLVVGVLTSGLPFTLYAFALMSLSTGMSGILNASTPMFGALVAWLWLGERLNRWRSLGLALGFVGVTVLAWDQTRFKAADGLAGLWAVLACLGACLSYGVSASYTRSRLAGVPSLVTAAGSQVGASLALALPTALTWPERMPSVSAWLALGTVGVLCTGVAYLLFYRVVQRAGPARSLAVAYLIPLFAVGYGLLLLGERLSPSMVIGGGVILLGTALATGMLAPARAPGPPP